MFNTTLVKKLHSKAHPFMFTSPRTPMLSEIKRTLSGSTSAKTRIRYRMDGRTCSSCISPFLALLPFVYLLPLVYIVFWYIPILGTSAPQLLRIQWRTKEELKIEIPPVVLKLRVNYHKILIPHLVRSCHSIWYMQPIHAP